MRTAIHWIDGSWPGHLGIAPRPRGGDWLADEIRGWRAANVVAVVSLLTPGEVDDLELAEEGPLCQGEGIAFRSLPIPDRGVPELGKPVSGLARSLLVHLLAGGNVLVHCRQGIGRASVVAASVFVVAGEDPDHVLAKIEHARGRPVPDTAAQRAWVERFAASLRRPRLAEHRLWKLAPGVQHSAPAEPSHGT